MCWILALGLGANPLLEQVLTGNLGMGWGCRRGGHGSCPPRLVLPLPAPGSLLLGWRTLLHRLSLSAAPTAPMAGAGYGRGELFAPERQRAEGPARLWGLGRWAQMEQGSSVTLPAGVTGVGVPLLTPRVPASLPQVLFICPLSDG